MGLSVRREILDTVLERVPATGVNGDPSTSYWSQWGPSASCRSERGVSVPLLQQVGVSATRLCRGNGVHHKNQLLGRTGVSEGSVAVSGAGPWVTVHVPGAGGGANVCVFLNRGVHSPANFKLDQPASVGHLGPGRGIRWVEGPCW